MYTVRLLQLLLAFVAALIKIKQTTRTLFCGFHFRKKKCFGVFFSNPWSIASATFIPISSFHSAIYQTIFSIKLLFACESYIAWSVAHDCEFVSFRF